MFASAAVKAAALKTVVAGAVLGAAMLAAPMAAGSKPVDNSAGEAELAKLLAGRVAGKPVNCISLIGTNSSRIIDRTAIVYDTGSVLYVNRPEGAASLESDYVLITHTNGDQLCSLDIVQLRDSGLHMYTGSVGLEQFVPYTRVPK